MKELPIIFSGDMVTAILDGRKTQTRRVVKLPHANPLGEWEPSTVGGHGSRHRDGTLAPEQRCIWHTRTGDVLTCPYGVPGDRLLWVRETWQYADWTEDGAPFIRYKADDQVMLRDGADEEWGEKLQDIWATLSDPDNYRVDNRAADRRWRSPIYLPRWASRIALEVGGVRVERLQDISRPDAVAEGCEGIPNTRPDRVYCAWDDDPLDQFCELWQEINGTWDENPWVWVIEFRRVDA